MSNLQKLSPLVHSSERNHVGNFSLLWVGGLSLRAKWYNYQIFLVYPSLIFSSCRGSTGLTKSAKELFGELGEGQLEDLVEVYKEDFDIHGYDPYSVLY